MVPFSITEEPEHFVFTFESLTMFYRIMFSSLHKPKNITLLTFTYFKLFSRGGPQNRGSPKYRDTGVCARARLPRASSASFRVCQVVLDCRRMRPSPATYPAYAAPRTPPFHLCQSRLRPIRLGQLPRLPLLSGQSLPSISPVGACSRARRLYIFYHCHSQEIPSLVAVDSFSSARSSPTRIYLQCLYTSIIIIVPCNDQNSCPIFSSNLC